MEKRWLIVCGLGGVLMILSSTTGDVSVYRMVFDLASDYLNGRFSNVFSIILAVIGLIASGGGFTVLAGTGIIASGYSWVGKFIVSLGAGMGILGLLVLLVTGIFSGGLVDQIFPIGPGFIGVLLTISARLKL